MRRFVDGEGEPVSSPDDSYLFPMQCATVLSTFGRGRECADFDVVVDRSLNFVSRGVEFEFSDFDLEGDVVPAVRTFGRCRRERPVGE